MKLLFYFLIKREFKCVYWYTRYLLDLQKILPSILINRIPVKENDEILVDIRTIVKDSQYVILGHEIPFFEIRLGAARKINDLIIHLESTHAPFGLYIDCLYRDLELQSKRFNERILHVKNEHPTWNSEEIIAEAKKYTAKPSLLSPHVTGAAVDLCLFDIATREKFLFGTKIGEMNEKTYYENEHISDKVKNNRVMLRSLMEQFGFNCYPGEWWHYSYGDQMWAAYKSKIYAIYGGIEAVNEKN